MSPTQFMHRSESIEARERIRKLGVLFLTLVSALLLGCSVSGTASIETSAPVETATNQPLSKKSARKTRRAENRAAIEPTATTAWLAQGPVVGAVTADSARVFGRTGRPASLRVRYGTTPDLGDAITTDAVQTDDASDFTGQVQLSGLEPDTPYFFDLLINDVPQLVPPYPAFKTFPPEGEAQAFKFVVLTDFGWLPTAVFRNAAQENPDFVIIGGDFSHTVPTTLELKRRLFRERYNRHGMLPEFPKLILDRFAVAHFWDDHDFGTNNSDKNYPDKVMSLEVLKDYFPVYPVTAHGDWQRFSYGDADFFLLDSRSQRDPSADADDANKSMLDGDELGADGQYAWLTNGLRDSTARWKFILTPVPFNPTVPKPEAWMSYRTERQKIIDFVRANNVEGVIMLSGDLHAGGIDDGTNADFPEMLVPSVNTKGCLTAPSPGTWSEGVYAGPRDEVCGGYGVITVETEPPRVVLEIKKDTGETAVEYSVNGDQ